MEGNLDINWRDIMEGTRCPQHPKIHDGRAQSDPPYPRAYGDSRFHEQKATVRRRGEACVSPVVELPIVSRGPES